MKLSDIDVMFKRIKRVDVLSVGLPSIAGARWSTRDRLRERRIQSIMSRPLRGK